MAFRLSLIALMVGSVSVQAQQTNNEIERLSVYGQHASASTSDALLAEKLQIDAQLLDQIKQQTLGETLATLPGISGNFFGTSASRPVIRGLGGSRVVMGINGTPVRDMSSISDDQLVPIEPFLASKITVIKGPSAVIPFGGNAMAGAVDVKDNRIPDLLANWQAEQKLEVQTGFNAADSFMGKASTQIDDMAFTGSLIIRDRGDYEVPDHAKAPECSSWDALVADYRLETRCQVELSNPVWEYNGTKYVDATPEEQQVITHTGVNSDGKVTNSGSRSTNALFGFSRELGDNQLFGLSFNRVSSEREIPGYIRSSSRHTHSHGATEQTEARVADRISIESNIKRVDGQYSVSFNDSSWLQRFDVDGVYSRQVDDEYLGRSIANSFEVKQLQLKPKLSYSIFGNHQGELALQLERQQHSGAGSDNYLPPVDTDSNGLYWLQTMHWQAFTVQVGARYDQVDYDVDENSDYAPGRGQGANIKDRDFDLHSYSGTIKWQALDNWWLKAAYTDAERAPTVNELYASNPHYALLTEEQGDSSLNKEQNESIEISTELTFGSLTLAGSWYDNRYSDFIYLGNTGVSRSDVFVREWRQGDTDNRGYELSASYEWMLNGLGQLSMDLFTDKTENKPRYHFDGTYDPFDFFNPRQPQPGEEAEYHRRTQDGSSVPRIPADRTGLELQWQYQTMTASLNYIYHDEQTLVAKYEQPSASYGLLNAYVSWQPSWLNSNGSVFIRANNLTDEDARPHQSFLRFLAPLPGRSVAIGLRYQF